MSFNALVSLLCNSKHSSPAQSTGYHCKLQRQHLGKEKFQTTATFDILKILSLDLYPQFCVNCKCLPLWEWEHVKCTLRMSYILFKRWIEHSADSKKMVYNVLVILHNFFLHIVQSIVTIVTFTEIVEWGLLYYRALTWRQNV